MSAGIKVLIAGAGIGGLSAALCLLQRGIDVEIFEQADAFREVGAGIQVAPNGTRVLRAMGLEEALQGVACVPFCARRAC